MVIQLIHRLTWIISYFAELRTVKKKSSKGSTSSKISTAEVEFIVQKLVAQQHRSSTAKIIWLFGGNLMIS